MNSNQIVLCAIHTVILFVIQVLLLTNLSFPLGDKYLAIAFIYPLIIMLLPISTPQWLLMLMAFGLGLGIDLFYQSPGVHAAATVFTAFIRPYVLRVIEPRGGYRIGQDIIFKSTNRQWAFTYLAILLLGHLLFYFCVQVFTFFYIDKIIINSLVSFIISYLLIGMYQFIFLR